MPRAMPHCRIPGPGSEEGGGVPDEGAGVPAFRCLFREMLALYVCACLCLPAPLLRAWAHFSRLRSRTLYADVHFHSLSAIGHLYIRLASAKPKPRQDEQTGRQSYPPKALVKLIDSVYVTSPPPPLSLSPPASHRCVPHWAFTDRVRSPEPSVRTLFNHALLS